MKDTGQKKLFEKGENQQLRFLEYSDSDAYSKYINAIISV